MDILDRRASLVLYGNVMERVEKGCDLLRISKDQVFEKLDAEFDDFRKHYEGIFMGADFSALESQAEIMRAVANLSGMFSHLWILRNGNTFVMDYNKAMHLPDVTDLNEIDLDGASDFYVNFQMIHNGRRVYLPLYISFAKTDVVILQSGSHENVGTWGMTCGIAGRDGISYEVTVTKELFPRLLGNADIIDTCFRCNKKNIRPLKIRSADKGTDIIHYCIVGNQHRKVCRFFEVEMNPQKALNVVSYIIRVYTNRHLLKRKNSAKRVAEYTDRGEVEVVARKTAESVDREVPLILYAKGEGREYIRREGTKHSHHESPREHTRQEHTRTLKSGKVVTVRQSVINKGKGKGKTVYRV